MVNPICLYLLIITLELSADFILLHFLLQSLMEKHTESHFLRGRNLPIIRSLLVEGQVNELIVFGIQPSEDHPALEKPKEELPVHPLASPFISLFSKYIVYLKDPASFLNLFDLSLFIMIYPFIPFTSFILLIQQLPAQVL